MLAGQLFGVIRYSCTSDKRTKCAAFRFAFGVKSIVILMAKVHHIIMWMNCELQGVVTQADLHWDRSEARCHWAPL
jgi:hypothetical protein